jgi:hypothetical protein
MSNMQIKIVDVDVQQGTTKAGKPYEFLEVSYKNLTFEGKAESKKVMPFGSKEVFATLKAAVKGDVFTLLREKDNAGYWQWTGIEQGDNVPMAASPAPSNAGPAKAATPAPKSTFETPEERAKKQVYIVRQSSISAAIDTLKTDKKAPSVDEVIAVAKIYEAFVFGINLDSEPAKLPDLPEDDDIPY